MGQSKASQTGVRPSLHVYAVLLGSTTFYWESNATILRSMLGQPASRQTGPKNEPPAYANSIPPNRRLVANLEMNIARYRDLLARGIIPEGLSFIRLKYPQFTEI